MKKWLTSSEDFVLPTVPHLSQNFYSIDLNKIEKYRKKSNHEKIRKKLGAIYFARVHRGSEDTLGHALALVLCTSMF